MDDAEKAAALAIIRTWSWERWDYDFCEGVPHWRCLSDVINQLAFDGHADPASVVLHLLADGALAAQGGYHWRACRNGERFSQQSNGAIPTSWWRSLRDGRAEWDWVNGTQINLPWLGITDADSAVWDWGGNKISGACKKGESEFDVIYEEEWFSARNIQVYCPSVGNNDWEASKSSVGPIGHSRGRPAKYDWEGALAYVAGVANTPDGLDTGPGAQAAIERLIADYFAQASNDGCAPCESEIRKRASRVMKAIGGLKPLHSKAA